MALTFVAGEASACWCGYSASVGNVSISQRMPNADYCPVDWEPRVVRAWGTWLVRLRGVAPGGIELDGFDGDFEKLFAERAREARLAPMAERLLRKRVARVLTVQVFASRSEARAREVAATLDQVEGIGENIGFFFAGDVPAENPTAHVIAERAGEGRTLHKVLVGAYLDEANARAKARAITETTHLAVFVRPL